MMLITDIFQGLVKMTSIRHVNIMRGKIDSPSKPPDTIRHFEVSNIHMNDWNHRVGRMKYDRDTSSKKVRLVSQIQFHRLHNSFRSSTPDSRKIHTSFFNDFAVTDNTRDSTASA